MRWTEADDMFLRKHVGNTPIKVIADCLNKTVRAVKLYCYRQNIPVRQTVNRPILVELMKIKFGQPEFFRPNRKFFDEVGIWKISRIRSAGNCKKCPLKKRSFQRTLCVC